MLKFQWSMGNLGLGLLKEDWAVASGEAGVEPKGLPNNQLGGYQNVTAYFKSFLLNIAKPSKINHHWFC